MTVRVRGSLLKAFRRSFSLAGASVAHYDVARKLGGGNFGTVYSGCHRRTGEPVAVKVEAHDSKQPRLPNEARVYQALGRQNPPRMRWFGRYSGHYVLVMDRLGPSLRTVHHASGTKSLDLRTLQRVGRDVLQRLEILHELGWLHLDVKPANIVTSLDRSRSQVSNLEGTSYHLLDYGLARRWCDSSTGLHKANPPRRGVVGTGRYASLTNHLGSQLGRRDDVESLAYTLAFLRNGSLPWSGVAAPTKAERFELMLNSKQRASFDEIATGMPASFKGFLAHVRSLAYNERPKYGLLHTLLDQMGE